MGWISNIGRRINRGFNDFTRTVTNPGQLAKDPLGTLSNFTVASRGGLPGQAAQHSQQEMKQMYDEIRKNPVTSYVVGQAGGVPGLIGASEVNNLFKQDEPPAPTQDERLKRIREEMASDADEFRSNLGAYKNRKKQGLIGDYADAKEEGVRRTRENYGRRGLLYSGLAQKGEAEMKGAIQSQYDRSVADINREAEQIADAKERAAAAAGIEDAQQLLNQAEQYYNLSAQNDLARRRAFGSLASGIGYGMGSIAGSGGGNEPKGLIGRSDTAYMYNPELYSAYGMS